MPVNVSAINDTIRTQVTAAVNEVARDAYDEAKRLAPIRKVFRYGRAPRTGLRVGGRQDTRPLSVEEAAGEARIRGRLGLPSAFPTTASGRRQSGSQPAVQTALFPGNYRSTDRRNDARSMNRRSVANIGGRERLVTIEHTEQLNSRGRKVQVSYPAINPVAESDLSARGKYELKRRKHSAIVGKGDERTLGGGLRKSITLFEATPSGSRIRASISAGNDEVQYAKYVEFGTRHARAQPFLRPALASAREAFLETVRTHLGG